MAIDANKFLSSSKKNSAAILIQKNHKKDIKKNSKFHEDTYKNLEQNSSKIETGSLEQSGNKLGTRPPCSSSDYIYKETTTDSHRSTTKTVGNWNMVFIPDLLKEMGLRQPMLDNIKTQLNHSPEKVQECMEAFAHDIEAEGGGERYKQNHKLRNPGGWFFNAMRLDGGYVSTTGNFISEEERANHA